MASTILLYSFNHLVFFFLMHKGALKMFLIANFIQNDCWVFMIKWSTAKYHTVSRLNYVYTAMIVLTLHSRAPALIINPIVSQRVIHYTCTTHLTFNSLNASLRTPFLISRSSGASVLKLGDLLTCSVQPNMMGLLQGELHCNWPPVAMALMCGPQRCQTPVLQNNNSPPRS